MKKIYLLLALFISITSCEKNEEVPTYTEIQQEKIFDKISMDQFLSNINSNEKLESFSKLFDINLSSSKTISNKNGQDNLGKAFILTDNIIKIKKEDFTTYTFTIFTQTENDEFYNLVLYSNNNNIIYKSHILKYSPSQKWLNDTEQHFSGNVKLVNNNILDVDNFINSKSAINTKENSADGCIVSVTSESVCSNGVSGHSDGNPGRSGGCYADSFELILTAHYGPCTGSGGGDFDPNTDSPSTGGGGGGESDGSIVTAPNTIPYTSQFKNFESGTLSTLERNYYQSNSNIKNTIDRFLIQKNFTSFSKSDAKSSLNFGEKLNLDFAQFNWAFLNRNSSDYVDITNYLSEVIITTEVQNFIQSLIDNEIVTNNNSEVDFVDHLGGYNFHEETSEILAFEQDYRSQMKNAEKAIFDNLTRFQKLDYLHSAFLAREYSQIYFENSLKVQYNGKGDAYRHTLWNALGAAKLGETLMEQLTNAHEVPDFGQPANPLLEKSMDLHNNQIGRNIANQSIFMLMMKVKFAVDAGKTKYLDPTNLDGTIIPNITVLKNTNE